MKPLSKKNESPSIKLRRVVEQYMHLDDPWIIDVVLGTIVANALPGDPLWVLLVNPSSSGKTEFVQMFAQVDYCAWLPEITDKTFLSGYKDDLDIDMKISNVKKSLLHRWTHPECLGENPPIRVMLIQDLTGLITQNSRTRDAIFGQLRQIFDGRLTRSTGMGDDLIWEGFLGLLGGVTAVYDQVAELNSILGERFLLYRPDRHDDEAEAIAALNTHKIDWRKHVASIAKEVVDEAVSLVPQVFVPKWIEQSLISLAQVTAMGRTGVARDGKNKVLKYLPQAEGLGRLVKQLAKLLKGLCAARGFLKPTEKELAILAKVAIDTMPKIRWVVIEALVASEWKKDTLSHITRIPPSTLHYILEDLRVIGIAEENNTVWSLTSKYREICLAARVFSPHGIPEAHELPDNAA